MDSFMTFHVIRHLKVVK